MKSVLITMKADTQVSVTEDTQFVINTWDYNDNGMPLMFTAIFETQGIKSEILCIYNLKEKEHLNIKTKAQHRSLNTSCLSYVRGVLGDFSSSNYVGSIVIERSAQQTSSFLDDKVLVIGDGTKNVSEPILEILANDVKASHGATTGRVDKGMIYYLTSRGLSEDEAKDLISKGFLESAISKIYDPKIQELVRKKLC